MYHKPADVARMDLLEYSIGREHFGTLHLRTRRSLYSAGPEHFKTSQSGMRQIQLEKQVLVPFQSRKVILNSSFGRHSVAGNDLIM
jgi:hypothetical protein